MSLFDKFSGERKIPQAETGSYYGKFFIIPKDPESANIMRKVDEQTALIVNAKYNITLHGVWQSTTIATVMTKTILRDLVTHIKRGEKGIGNNFYDIFSTIVSVKKNENAEKEGNINVFFEPGNFVFEMIKNGPEEIPEYKEPVNVETYFLTGNNEDDMELTGLDKVCAYILQNEHGIKCNNKMIVTAISVEYFKNLFTQIITELVSPINEENIDDERLVTVNFNDYIEIHGLYKDRTASIKMRPGFDAKLAIKNDEFTEQTIGYGDA